MAQADYQLFPEAGGCFSLSLEMESSEGAAGDSAEIRSRTAARTLPSSSLAATAWLIVGEFWRLSLTINAGASDVNLAGNVEIRFLMVADRLWRFPPRLGGFRIAPPQLNRSSHFATEAGSCTIDRSVYYFFLTLGRYIPEGFKKLKNVT